MDVLTTKTRCDVAVIGGGPAGAVAALLAVRAGLDTLVIERATFPRDKVCGGTLNGNAISALVTAGARSALTAAGSVALRRFELHAGDSRVDVPLTLHEAVARRDFDAELLRLAESAGARVFLGANASIVDHGTENVNLEARTEVGRTPIRARVVVAADGLGSRVLGESTVAERSRIGAGAVLDCADDSLPAGVLRMAVGRGGYVGLVRLPSGELDVAAALDAEFVRGRTLGRACDDLLEQAGLDAPRLRDRSLHGTTTLTRTPASVARGRVFAVGDAAGYVEPFTGEGMGWAFSCALALAPLLARAVAGDVDVASEYTRSIERAVRARQRLCRSLAWTLRHPALVEIAVTLLRAFPSLASNVIAHLDRTPRSAGATP